MADGYQEFKVDLSTIHCGRRPGISGMMRVRNDAEFIEACVESCIDALDELVIVYNDCTDSSPEVIARVAGRYPDKIRVYEYLPKVICGSISREEYERARSLPEDSVELLCNYYNYALARTTCTHVMKIDADQIYFSDLLRELCDGVRRASLTCLSPANVISFMRVARKLRYYDWQPGDFSTADFRRYRRVLEFLCRKGVLSAAMSGINLFIAPGDKAYVTQGCRTGNLNVLGQFNGTTDHLIFKVRKGVHFRPFDDPDYALHTSASYTYIEKLAGMPRPFQWGLMWWHLNAMRSNIYARQLENLAALPDAFRALDDFRRTDAAAIPFNSDFVQEKMAQNYRFYWTFCRSEVPAPPSLVAFRK